MTMKETRNVASSRDNLEHMPVVIQMGLGWKAIAVAPVSAFKTMIPTSHAPEKTKIGARESQRLSGMVSDACISI